MEDQRVRGREKQGRKARGGGKMAKSKGTRKMGELLMVRKRERNRKNKNERVSHSQMYNYQP